MNYFLLSQILGVFAFLTGLAGYQCKEHRNILICFAICSFLTAAHFILLSATTAAAVVGISGFRHLTAIFTKTRTACISFLLILAVSTVFTYEAPINLLATLSAALGTVASFSKKPAHARIIWMISSSTYIAHNFIINSPVATMMESVFLISNIYMYQKLFGRSHHTRNNVAP